MADTIQTRRPAIESPKDGLRSTWARVSLALQAGLVFEDIAKAGIQAGIEQGKPEAMSSGQPQALPPGSLLDPFQGKKAVVAEIRAKIGPFIPIVDALTHAGNDCKALEDVIHNLESRFVKIDTFKKTLVDSKDLDTKAVVAKLDEKSKKIRQTINATKTNLQTINQKIKDITTEKTQKVKEARQSPLNHVGKGIIEKLETRIYKELTQELIKAKKTNQELEKDVQRQIEDTKSIATPKGKQMIDETLRM